MAKKNKAPGLRDLGNEVGTIGGLSASQLGSRNAALLSGTTGNFNSLIGTLTSARGKEIASNTKLLKGDKALSKANQSVQAATQQYTQPTALQGQLDATASAALSDPTAGNATLGQLIASTGPSSLLQTMQGQAATGLNDNGQLNAEEVRLATQGGRAAYGARGLGLSAPSALAEVLNRQQYVTGRQDRARAYAGGVEQLGQGSRAQDIAVGGLTQSAIDSGRNFALGTNAQDLDFNKFALGAKTNAAQFRLQTDPKLLAYQTPSQIPGALGTAAGITSQADPYSSLLQYGSDVNNTNFNALESRYNAELNRQAALQGAQLQAGAASGAGSSAMTGALIGAGGAIAGGLIIF